jgi:hypothetical protein
MSGSDEQQKPPPNSGDEAYWRAFLQDPDSMMGVGRRVFSRLPANPRCQLCASPFAGAGGAVMRTIGKKQSGVNPNVCTTCERQLLKRRGGAEVDTSTLFADIRGSTALGEQLSLSDFRATLNRYYSVASDVVYEHGGLVDKFVGDELVRRFRPSSAPTTLGAQLMRPLRCSAEPDTANREGPGFQSARASTRAASGSALSARETMSRSPFSATL